MWSFPSFSSERFLQPSTIRMPTLYIIVLLLLLFMHAPFCDSATEYMVFPGHEVWPSENDIKMDVQLVPQFQIMANQSDPVLKPGQTDGLSPAWSLGLYLHMEYPILRGGAFAVGFHSEESSSNLASIFTGSSDNTFHMASRCQVHPKNIWELRDMRDEEDFPDYALDLNDIKKPQNYCWLIEGKHQDWNVANVNDFAQRSIWNGSLEVARSLQAVSHTAQHPTLPLLTGFISVFFNYFRNDYVLEDSDARRDSEGDQYLEQLNLFKKKIYEKRIFMLLPTHSESSKNTVSKPFEYIGSIGTTTLQNVATESVFPLNISVVPSMQVSNVNGSSFSLKSTLPGDLSGFQISLSLREPSSELPYWNHSTLFTNSSFQILSTSDSSSSFEYILLGNLTLRNGSIITVAAQNELLQFTHLFFFDEVPGHIPDTPISCSDPQFASHPNCTDSGALPKEGTVSAAVVTAVVVTGVVATAAAAAMVVGGGAAVVGGGAVVAGGAAASGAGGASTGLYVGAGTSLGGAAGGAGGLAAILSIFRNKRVKHSQLNLDFSKVNSDIVSKKKEDLQPKYLEDVLSSIRYSKYSPYAHCKHCYKEQKDKAGCVRCGLPLLPYLKFQKEDLFCVVCAALNKYDQNVHGRCTLHLSKRGKTSGAVYVIYRTFFSLSNASKPKRESDKSRWVDTVTEPEILKLNTLLRLEYLYTLRHIVISTQDGHKRPGLLHKVSSICQERLKALSSGEFELQFSQSIHGIEVDLESVSEENLKAFYNNLRDLYSNLLEVVQLQMIYLATHQPSNQVESPQNSTKKRSRDKMQETGGNQKNGGSPTNYNNRKRRRTDSPNQFAPPNNMAFQSHSVDQPNQYSYVEPPYVTHTSASHSMNQFPPFLNPNHGIPQHFMGNARAGRSANSNSSNMMAGGPAQYSQFLHQQQQQQGNPHSGMHFSSASQYPQYQPSNIFSHQQPSTSLNNSTSQTNSFPPVDQFGFAPTMPSHSNKMAPPTSHRQDIPQYNPQAHSYSFPHNSKYAHQQTSQQHYTTTLTSPLGGPMPVTEVNQPTPTHRNSSENQVPSLGSPVFLSDGATQDDFSAGHSKSQRNDFSLLSAQPMSNNYFSSDWRGDAVFDDGSHKSLKLSRHSSSDFLGQFPHTRSILSGSSGNSGELWKI